MFLVKTRNDKRSILIAGHEMETQILACECLCNLALGAEVACNKVVLAASSYLLTILDCTCPRLQVGRHILLVSFKISIQCGTPICRLRRSGQLPICVQQAARTLLAFLFHKSLSPNSFHSWQTNPFFRR